MPDLPEGLFPVLKKQFGTGCGVEMSNEKFVTSYIHKNDYGPWTPAFVGDVDGDGSEDIVIVARCKDALGGASQFDYKVVDPLNAYYGWGNPKITTQFSAQDPDKNLVLLVIHGAGKEGWRAEHPKAKFAIINLHFANVALSGATLKKKAVAAVRLDESDGISSLLFFDGKKWKYAPGAAGGGN
jgi:hypothetical protein